MEANEDERDMVEGVVDWDPDRMGAKSDSLSNEGVAAIVALFVSVDCCCCWDCEGGDLETAFVGSWYCENSDALTYG